MLLCCYDRLIRHCPQVFPEGSRLIVERHLQVLDSISSLDRRVSYSEGAQGGYVPLRQ